MSTELLQSPGFATLQFHLADLDVQHRRLGELVRNVVDSVRNPGSKFQNTCSAFSRLVEYAQLHFSDEEQFMSQHGYPEADLRSHQAQHAAFVDRLSLAHREFCNGWRPHASAVEELCCEWIEAHSTHEDQAYIEYFRCLDGD